MAETRKLRVFLCHSSQDKSVVRELYERLNAEGWIDPWLDEEKLLPGQDWDMEIEKAVEAADAVIVCLSKSSVGKEGYIQKEIKKVLDIADQKPEGAIFIIPLRLEDCKPPRRLVRWQYVDYFVKEDRGKIFTRLLQSLVLRGKALGLEFKQILSKVESTFIELGIERIDITTRQLEKNYNSSDDLYEFIYFPSGGLPKTQQHARYPFWIGKYPITNSQYERFLNAPDFANPAYWSEFPKFDENCRRLGNWGTKGFEWLQKELKKEKSIVLKPDVWDDSIFGNLNPNHPVVGVSWYEANAYAKWLLENWNTQIENKINTDLEPTIIRLPLETEWVIAAGGDEPKGRYPWDKPKMTTNSLKEVLLCANVEESVIEHTTPVTAYPFGKSPYNVADLAGNVWEWQANYYDKNHSRLAMRGGSWDDHHKFARTSARYVGPPGYGFYYDVGFRIVGISSD